MSFGVIEWFVLVFSIGVIVKIIVVSFNAGSWFRFAKNLYRSPVILFVIELILGAVLFYSLLNVITLVQIVASLALGALLTAMVFTVYSKESLEWAQKLLKNKSVLKRAWFPVILWLALAVAALISLFS